MNSSTTYLKKVLIIEDDAMLREFLSKRFSDKGIEVSTAEDGEDGLSKLLSEHPEAAIVDVLIPKKNGFAILDEYHAKEPKGNARMIMLTNLDDMQYAANAMEKKAFAYIVKSDRSLEAVADLIEQQLLTTSVASV